MKVNSYPVTGHVETHEAKGYLVLEQRQ